MPPLLKWSLAALAALLVLVGGATLLVRMLVDEQQLGAALVEVANSRIDGELRIGGSLSLSLFPRLALTANDVHLRTPAGAGTDFAAARELRLGVALLPLLRQELRVSELAIDGLTLNAECDASGCNWAGLAGRERGSQPATPTDAGAAAPLLLSIARVQISDSTVAYADRATGVRYELAGLDLRGAGINLDGEPFHLEGKAVLGTGAGRRELAIALAADVAADRDAGSVVLGKASLALTPAAGPALALDLPAATIDLNGRSLDAPALKITATGLALDGSVSATWSDPAAPAANGHVAIGALDLPALLAAAGASLPPGLNAAPMRDIALDAAFALDDRNLTLSSLKLRAGSFTGEGSMTLGLGATKRIDATLASPELDLDYFFPPAAEPRQSAADAPPAAAATPGAQPGGLAALLTVDGDIETRLGRLRKGKLELGDIHAALTLGKGSARLQKLDAGLYGGTLHATGALSAHDGSGSMKLAAQLAAVDLKALLAATGGAQKFEGRLSGSLQLAAQGADPAQWQNTLSGPLQLGIDDAVLRGVSVEEVVCQAAAQLNREALTASFEPVTRFRGIQAALDFQQGVGTFRQLGATVPNMSLRGEGRIDLPRRKLHVQLDTRVTDDLSARDPACRMTRKMLAIEWPVTCKGSFDEDPKRWCRIDEDDLAKIAAQFATEKVQDKLLKKLGDFLNRD